ncbi:16S rRNA (cytosine(967)-C(5))-methyltransferase RsmB [Faucicola boevrei]|uniref:16S rRNA (cytosine(967)-C(5))-methyltransferase RsmB n=1 Tax=Faucicola boevrei TaxID=346665 RepID=UPI00035C9868|nr:16S rRNA (cytosine(967)-C(5))-methyltransferase RsmB [Moraxella boevrei]
MNDYPKTDWQKLITNKKLSTRAKVIATLEKIHHGFSLAVLLDDLLNNVNDTDKGFAHELLIGTLRQWWALNRIGESLIEQEVTDKGVLSAVNIGIYQLIYMHTPDYASINDTVEAVKQLDKGYGAGLVNAILRKVAKNPAKFAKKVQKNHSLPNHLAKILKQDWAEYYEELGQSLRKSAPIFLRVNAKFCTMQKYSELLNAQNITHDIVKTGVGEHTAIRLIDNLKISNLPHFSDGWLSVQDLHAQICGGILADFVLPKLSKNINILDACTAPGGKLAQLLEMFHVEQFNEFQPKITALDNDENRLKRVHDNLNRLQLTNDNTQIICADGVTFKSDKPYNMVILDAPCTATGVIRRHPDICLLRKQNDIESTINLQLQILQNLWQSVAQNGYLLYITCSLIKAENVAQIEHFLNKNTDVQVVDFEFNLPNQIKQTIGYQCLPIDENGGDGFYYALLQKLN